jgi:hypothetical protein
MACPARWRGGGGAVVADRLDFQPHQHLVADGILERGDAEVAPVQRGGGGEAGDRMQAVDSAGEPVELERHVHRLAHAAQGELAVDHAVAVVGALHRGAGEVRIAVAGGIEQGWLEYRLGPVGIDVQAVEVDVQFGGRAVPVIRIEAQPAAGDMEPPPRTRVAVVGDVEEHLAVHGVEAVAVGGGLRGRQAAECEGGENDPGSRAQHHLTSLAEDG